MTTTPILSDQDFYNPLKENWYTARPYGFKWTPKDGNAVVMYLPISPSNLTISTNFATSVVATLYGTVEEHSPVRYYDITIEGTTGMGPKYVEPFREKGSVPKTLGRSSFSVKQAVPDVAGFFQKTLSAARDALTKATDLLNPPKLSTGLTLDQTGYWAFHNLYRFLLKYKQDSSSSATRKDEKGHPLIFFNYKDNNQYKVVIKSFTLRRDKDDPMSYHYSISMRGYDLESAGQTKESSDNEALRARLGLSGINGSPVLRDIRKQADAGKAALASAVNGITQVGS